MTEQATITVTVQSATGVSVTVDASVNSRALKTPNAVIQQVVIPAALTAIQDWTHRNKDKS